MNQLEYRCNIAHLTLYKNNSYNYDVMASLPAMRVLDRGFDHRSGLGQTEENKLGIC